MQSKELTPIHGSKTTLIWDDLLFLYKRNFCLRAVDNEQAAYREKDVGGRGDAVSLSTFAYPGARCESKIFNYLQERNYLSQGGIESCYSMVCTWLAHDLFKSDEFSEERSELITRMHDGITLLVTQAFEYSQKPGFLLLRFNDYIFPYEIGDRYPLGKMGKRNFTEDTVQAVIVKEDGNSWDENSAVNAIISQITNLRLLCNKHQDLIQKNSISSNDKKNYNECFEWEKKQLAYEAEMKKYEAVFKKYIVDKEKFEMDSIGICPRRCVCTLF
jgi:hypothetical protein